MKNVSANKNKYEMDMCSGSLLPKILLYSLPLMLSGILQLLFNAADIVVVDASRAMTPWRRWGLPVR